MGSILIPAWLIDQFMSKTCNQCWADSQQDHNLVLQEGNFSLIVKARAGQFYLDIKITFAKVNCDLLIFFCVLLVFWFFFYLVYLFSISFLKILPCCCRSVLKILFQCAKNFFWRRNYKRQGTSLQEDFLYSTVYCGQWLLRHLKLPPKDSLPVHYFQLCL